MTNTHADRIAKAEEDTTEYVTQHDEVTVTIQADTYSTDDVRNLVEAVTKDADPVNHPPHYTSSPAACACGRSIECIEITEHMNFCLGNATKYIWRAGLKSDDPSEDLLKARWYIDRELSRLGGSDA